MLSLLAPLVSPLIKNTLGALGGIGNPFAGNMNNSVKSPKINFGDIINNNIINIHNNNKIKF